MSAQQQGRPQWWRVLTDLVALTFPWVLIFKQAGIGFAPPAEVSEPILWLAGLMLGVPGVGQIVALRFGGTGTEGSQQPGPSPVSPPSVSSSSTSGVET